jgi:hypothetical protein
VKSKAYESKVDYGIFLAALAVYAAVLIRTDNERLAAASAVITFVFLALVYSVIAKIIGAPKMALHNFVGDIITFWLP